MKKSVRKKTSKPQKFIKKFKWILLAFFILLLGISAFIYHKKDTQTVKKDVSSTEPVYPSIAPISTKNWKTYSNRRHGFTIQYPPDYTVSCNDCGVDKLEDDIEWAAANITFTPKKPFSNETISIGVEVDPEQPKPNESMNEYIQRRFPTSAEQHVESLTTETKVGEYNALQVVSEYGYDIYMVQNYFFYNNNFASISFTHHLFDGEERGKRKTPIYEYPTITVYHQMLKTFKQADLPQVRKITSSYQPSPDGSFYIQAKPAGYGERIILVDKNGTPIDINTSISVKQNPEFFKPLRCWECGTMFGGWISNDRFTLRLVGAFMNEDDSIRTSEYEYVVDAKTGEIVSDIPLKQVK